MAEKTRGVQNRTTRKKSLNMKRRFQRTMSMSVLSSHLSVKVYDSHADTASNGSRGYSQRNKLERKKYSLQEMRNTNHFESNYQRALVGEWKSRNGISPATTVLNASFNSIPYADYNLSYDSNLLKNTSNKSRRDSAINNLQNKIRTYASDTSSTDSPREIISAEFSQDHLSCDDILSSNHKKSISAMTTGLLMPTRQNLSKYAVTDCYVDTKAEYISDTVKMYRKHSKEAKRREKSINDIQLQAKVRVSSKNNAINLHGLSYRSRKPRRLSPLREKPRLPEDNKAIKDNRFEKLIQSLTKVNIH